MQPFLDLNGRRYNFQSLNTIVPQSEFEKSALTFIQEWQSGKSSFSLQTSGSTGAPKLITIKREQMVASAKMTLETLNLSSEDVSLLCLPVTFIGGKMILVRSLINNMSIVAVEPTSNPLQQAIDADFTAMTPMQMAAVVQSSEGLERLNRFKVVILGGSPVSQELQEKLDQIKCKVYSTYGMTETVSHIALKKLNGENKTKYFQAFTDVSLGLDKRECLTIKGAVTDDKTIITNDRVNLLDNNRFEWLGRVDNVINTGGIKVQSETVEQEIAKLFAKIEIKNRFFIGSQPDSQLGEKVTLFIEGELIHSPEYLNNLLREHLSKYECPKDIIRLEQFIETATGKINRKATIDQKN